MVIVLKINRNYVSISFVVSTRSYRCGQSPDSLKADRLSAHEKSFCPFCTTSKMETLYDAAEAGDLDRVKLLVEQGTDRNQVGGYYRDTALSIAAENGHSMIVRYLVEKGADMQKVSSFDWTPLLNASRCGHFEVVRYLLEQGADRDKADRYGYTSLHWAALHGDLEIAKLLMMYGADLNARTGLPIGHLPIDVAANEEIRQAIRDEPRRRLDHGHKRATEQDRIPNATTITSGSAQHEEEKEELEAEDAEENESSEPSDEEDD